MCVAKASNLCQKNPSVIANTNASNRKARRYANRHGLYSATALHSTKDLTVKPSPDAAHKTRLRYCGMVQKPVTSPFIRLQSLSNGRTFCLWIKKTVVAEAFGTSFSSNGLSAVSTVPEF